MAALLFHLLLTFMHHLSKLLLELRDYFRDRVGVDVQNLCVVNVLPSNAGALLFIHHSVRYARADVPASLDSKKASTMMIESMSVSVETVHETVWSFSYIMR